MEEPLSDEEREAQAQALVERTEALRRKVEEREYQRKVRSHSAPDRLPYSDRE